MLKTISNEWRNARSQFARVTALSTAILALAPAIQARAEIIKLLCEAQITVCSNPSSGDASLCGKPVEDVIIVDTAKNLVDGLPAIIRDDTMIGVKVDLAGVILKKLG